MPEELPGINSTPKLPTKIQMTKRKSRFIKIAREIYRLTQDELECFDYTYRFQSAMFEDTARDCEKDWQRDSCGDRARRVFLRVIWSTTEPTAANQIAMEEIPSLARYFAFRVEEILRMRNNR